MNSSKTGRILSFIYFGLFLLAGIYAIYLLVFYTSTSEFCGLPAILLTLPWSMLFIPIINALGIVEWYSRFSGQPVIYGLCAMLTLLPGALINTGFLYFLGAVLERNKVR